MLKTIDRYARWGLANDRGGLIVAIAVPAFVSLAALIGSIV